MSPAPRPAVPIAMLAGSIAFRASEFTDEQLDQIRSVVRDEQHRRFVALVDAMQQTLTGLRVQQAVAA